MRVLILENSPGCGLQMKSELEVRGHEVTWITGIARLGASKFLGILPSRTPNNQLFGVASDADMSRCVDVDPTEFDFALCGSRLLGDVTDGALVVPVLVAAGVICCANTVAANDRLIAAGAQLAISMLFTLRAIGSGVLESAAEAARLDVQKANGKLQDFEQQARAELAIAGRQFKTGFDCIDNQA